MSNETTPKDQNGEWAMPAPIFRSSEGRTPGAKSEAVTDEIETDIPEVDETQDADEGAEVFDETAMNHVRAAPVKAVEKKSSGCAGGALMTIAVVMFIAAALLGAAIYFLYYAPSVNNGNF